ncbi:TFIIB-type zinc ribbon-containing protein [Haloarchaeobius iranensis]|uniref:Transcription factor zinc-finger n=1 Tax=Haloarchaeobius iranensis TaxID=996166 RepID=A0A1G9TR72_9EURY|nr:zf-TFIIB domain-containing protein [Haloarchaeobius iranensis]SDM50230.1 Transcription factor zinc-finger [Haloarchaeobius iranensis]
MKECPRCGSSLSAYSLSDVEAYGCDSCGWVGVPVDHKSEPKRLESWQDAIQRFQKKFAADGLEEHAERLERVEQARRDAVNGAVDETEAAGDGAPATAEDEGDEPAVDDETTEDDAGTEPEETTDGTEEGTDVPDDGDAADSEAATTAGDGSEPDAPDESEADAGEAADSDDTDDEAEAADEEPSSDDEEVEVAADGAGQ